MSSSLQVSPLMAYSLAPFRKSTREMVTSEYSIGSWPSVLSIVSSTSALPRGALLALPAKMTSSIFPPRRVFGPCSPMTQANPSTTLDLPDPFGPTTQVMPGSNCKVVGWAKDLKPLRVMLFRYNAHSPRFLVSKAYPRLPPLFAHSVLPIRLAINRTLKGRLNL